MATIQKLKEYIQSRDARKLSEYIAQYPEVLGLEDENGASGLACIAYSKIEGVVKEAIALKGSLTFHEAIICGKLGEVKAKLDGDDTLANRFSNDGFTPVALASYFSHDEIVRVLIDAGADPNLRAINTAKVNALHAAVANQNIALCEFLLNAGSDVNLPQSKNITPLHVAAHRGNLALVELLVARGALVDYKNDNGENAIDLARKDGHAKVASFLQDQ